MKTAIGVLGWFALIALPNLLIHSIPPAEAAGVVVGFALCACCFTSSITWWQREYWWSATFLAFGAALVASAMWLGRISA